MTDLSRARAEPPVQSEAEGLALGVVSDWLGMFDPPPQIDFQQSEFLQGAIKAALLGQHRAHAEEVERLTAEVAGWKLSYDAAARQHDIQCGRAEAAEAKLAATPPNASAAVTETIDRVFAQVSVPTTAWPAARYLRERLKDAFVTAALAKADAGGRPGPVAGEVAAWLYEHDGTVYAGDRDSSDQLSELQPIVTTRRWAHCQEPWTETPLLASRQTPKPDAGSSGEVDAGGWPLMESAPKDGTDILLWLASPWDEAAIAHWFEPWGCWIKRDDGDPALLDDERYGVGADIPTHWRPLPAPPQQPKQDGSAS